MTSAVLRLARGVYAQLAWPVAVGVTALVSGRLAAQPATLRVVMAGAVLALMVGFAVHAPKKLLFGLAVWLVALGLLRRLATGLSAAGEADPLLLVAAAALGLLTLAASQQGAFQSRTGLANAVLGLNVLIVLGAFNPLQGSVVAGITALLFLLVPTLAFWVGRGLLDEITLPSLMRLLAFLALGAGLYGLWQTFGSFPSWDQRWVENAGYEALYVAKDVVRPFGTSSSASEYTTLLIVGMVIWIGLGRRLGPPLLRVAAIGLLAMAVFYSSSRGPVVIVVVTIAFMAAVWRRLPIVPTLAAGAVALLLLPVVVAFVAPQDSSNDLVSHQVSGLLHPFDSEKSTVGRHMSLVWDGLESAVSYPLGQGISKTNLAGEKFGTGNQNTESDLSNAAVALGIPGLLLYGGIVIAGCRLAFREASGRWGLKMVLFGVVVVTAFQWLNGAHYAVAWLPWLLLGWLDRQRQDEEEEEAASAAEEDPAETGRPEALAPQPRGLPA